MGEGVKIPDTAARKTLRRLTGAEELGKGADLVGLVGLAQRVDGDAVEDSGVESVEEGDVARGDLGAVLVERGQLVHHVADRDSVHERICRVKETESRFALRVWRDHSCYQFSHQKVSLSSSVGVHRGK